MTFREVYDEHFRFVWRSLRRLGVPERDVDDATQDVFLVVARSLASFEGRSKLTTWLFGICLRVAKDRRGSAYERRRADAPHGLAEQPDERADAATELERRRRMATLERLLDELPLEQRAVFTLFELEGMPGDDIAEALGIPPGTVSSRLRLAREAFRRAVARLEARDTFLETARGAR